MWRGLVLLLLLANAIYFAWSQGHLQGVGFAPVPVSEPQRLQQQIKPESLRLLKPDELRRLEAGGTLTAVVSPPPSQVASAECLMAGPFDEIQGRVLQQTLASALPAGQWLLEVVTQPARWIVYMGKYPSTEAVQKKKSELRALRLVPEPVENDALEPGLSLGRFESQAAAGAALAAMSQRGVRTARVVRERDAVSVQQLRLPTVDAALRGRLDEFKPMLAGNALRACS